MGTGFAKKKKQAKMMQEKFSQLQEQLKNTEATGTAGNGLVTITMNGDHEVLKVSIKPDCVDPEDVEGLEDLIKAALNDASKQLRDNEPQMPGMPDLSSLGF